MASILHKRGYFLNILVSLIALLAIALMLELFLFRVVLVASDLPMLAENNGGVLKYRPNQTGRYRVKNEINEVFVINGQGWNSGIGDYTIEKTSNKPRICVIGDSYIEALQVNNTNSVSEQLARNLGDVVDSVYRFGISGAPLSQYLYMLENEVIQYSPNLVVINLVHNDFTESVNIGSGTYSLSFAHLGIEDGEVEFIHPKPYQRNMTWWIKKSATFRYLWAREKFRSAALKSVLLSLFQDDKKDRYAGNIDITSINDEEIVATLVYVFSRLQEIQSKLGIKFLLLIDADRSYITSQNEQRKNKPSPLSNLNKLVVTYANRYELPIIDLHPILTKDYELNGIPFSFQNDGHWNYYTHQLVARVITSKVLRVEFDRE